MTLDTEPVYFFQLKNMIEIPEAIVIGGFSISLYGLCLTVAALLGILVTVFEARRRGHEPEEYLTVLCLVFFFGMLGGRLFYALFHYGFFKGRFGWIFDIRTGGLSFYGTLFGAWLAVRGHCNRKQIELTTVMDSLCTAASFAAIPVWFGCILQKEPFGGYYSGRLSMAVRTDFLYWHNAELPAKGLEQNTRLVDGELYTSMHPVALYGLVLSICVVLCLQCSKRYLKKDGDLFFLYLMLVALENLVLSLLSLEQEDFFGIRIPMVTILSVILLLMIPLHLYFQRRHKRGLFQS